MFASFAKRFAFVRLNDSFAVIWLLAEGRPSKKQRHQDEQV
jgi:hypothetical protein